MKPKLKISPIFHSSSAIPDALSKDPKLHDFLLHERYRTNEARDAYAICIPGRSKKDSKDNISSYSELMWKKQLYCSGNIVSV